jgi:hypothetical protein
LENQQGGYWIAYRPIIRCELITPATRSNPQMMLNPEEHPLEDEVNVNGGNGLSGDGEALGAMGELPPGYEEDLTTSRRPQLE